MPTPNGWVKGGAWDRAVSGVGLTGNDFAVAMSQICRGIYQRGSSLVDFFYTDAMDAQADQPTVDQIVGGTFRDSTCEGPMYKRFFEDARTWIEENAAEFYTDALFETPVDPDLWNTANVGVPEADPDKGPYWAPNWVRIKNCLDAMRWRVVGIEALQECDYWESVGEGVPSDDWFIDPYSDPPIEGTSESAYAYALSQWPLHSDPVYTGSISNRVQYSFCQKYGYTHSTAGTKYMYRYFGGPRQVTPYTFKKRESSPGGATLGVMFDGYDSVHARVKMNGIAVPFSERGQYKKVPVFDTGPSFSVTMEYTAPPESFVYDDTYSETVNGKAARYRIFGVLVDLTISLSDQN